MDIEKLEHVAKTLVAPGKGLLAADETNVVCERWFDGVGVHCTEETRRQYRELLITAPDAEQNLSGVALREEALFQATEQGQLFREYLKNHHMLPGIAVDKGAVDLPGFPSELVTQGLDALPGRMHTFAAAGVFFAKWHMVIVINDDAGAPTDEAIGANTLAAARYARICQEAGVVPVINAEVRFEGGHDIDRAEAVTSHVFDILFATMRAFKVHLPGVVLGANPVLPGSTSNAQASHDEIADRTCRVLHEHVPHDLGGVVFMDAGQSATDVFMVLNKVAQRGPHPWGVSFSYGRALQEPALTTWAKDPHNQHEAKTRFTERLQKAAAASKGQLDNNPLDQEDFSPTSKNDWEIDDMKLRLEQMQANCAQARKAMERARAEHFAFGAFNLDDEATLKAVVLAAKAKNAPVLVEVSQGEVDDIGIQTVRDMVDNFKADYGVEIYINLDHSPSVEAAKKAIDAGYEFIHIDVSQANHDASDEEIINATREVVEYAKKTGAIVESEPHYFGGSSNLHTEAIDYEAIKKTFSTPEGTKAFVDATGIDTFAAAIGNLHGKYPVPKQLDLDLLQRIRNATDCNISLHGGSGTPGEQFEEAVRIGVTKININSDMRIAYREALEKTLADNPKESSVSKLVGKDVVPVVQAIVESKIDSFNSTGKARP